MYRREVLGVAAGSVAGVLGVGSVRGASVARVDADGRAGTADAAATGAGQSDFAPLATLPIEGAREAVVGPDGETVFLAVGDGFAVADVADPTAPRLVAERRGLLPAAEGGPTAEVQDVAVDGDRLLVMGPAHNVDGPRAAFLYDVSDPAEPSQVAVHRTDYPIHNGTLDGGLAYLTANDGEASRLEIVAIEPGAAATGDGDGAGGDFGVGETRVLGRWSPVDADPAWADVPRGIRPIHDVIVHRGVAYCSYWDAGTWLVDVSDPAEARALGRVGERTADELASVDAPRREGTELPGNHHSAAVDETGSLLAVGHEAWDENGDGEGGPGGIDLVDVSTPGSPTRRSTIEPPPTDDPSPDGVWTTAHNFELRGGYLYSAWYRGGVRVHDVSDPGAPREVAAWRDAETTRFWTAKVAAGAGDGAIVASSAHVDEDDPVESGLYTFPLPAPLPTESPSRRQVTATPGMDGFGAGAALAGAGLATLLAVLRRRG